MDKPVKSSYLLIPDPIYDLGYELGLDLRGITIYAAIYGFCQDGKSTYDGGQAMLMRRACCTKPTLIKCLNHLIELGCVRKTRRSRGGCSYFAIAPELYAGAGKETLPCGKETLPCSKETLPCGKETLLPSENNSKINKNNSKNTPASAGSVSDELRAEFEKIWQLYPRRQGREQALEAYVRARVRGVPRDDIAAGIARYCEYIDASNMPMRYVMQGGRYFEEKRWEDEHPPAAPPPKEAANPALGYRQRKYTRADLKAIGVDFGDEDDDRDG